MAAYTRMLNSATPGAAFTFLGPPTGGSGDDSGGGTVGQEGTCCENLPTALWFRTDVQTFPETRAALQHVQRLINQLTGVITCLCAGAAAMGNQLDGLDDRLSSIENGLMAFDTGDLLEEGGEPITDEYGNHLQLEIGNIL